MNFSKEWNRLSQETKNLIRSYQENMPVKLGALAKDLGLVVKKSALGARYSGEIRLESELYVIRVNRLDSKDRQRFTLAHEIGHFLLHKEYIGDGILDDVLYRSQLSNRKEAEANRLAADILMPWDKLEEIRARHANLKREQRLEKISDEMGVSVPALRIRLDIK
ncbi:MAG: ImmA/IrrE family metallo-endopeptidase [Hydrogenovibrio sp.]|uniref:ImmA/IrrE family metallo-endopeptidase n=1 Tax=Hydrogenovibrio sp. TaxID=2065821 RepID=UPI0028702681|nr:ImmA/IrrE family metallo-endopeptidase [Hydrogenovibrio sp.]MDR9497983.1 ImmA/IrrE family metallo-endopeptidase [Hydrogenovibrio sp.]